MKNTQYYMIRIFFFIFSFNFNRYLLLCQQTKTISNFHEHEKLIKTITTFYTLDIERLLPKYSHRTLYERIRAGRSQNHRHGTFAND